MRHQSHRRRTRNTIIRLKGRLREIDED
jgi:hypothetical protein